jgi:hypothetical protein
MFFLSKENGVIIMDTHEVYVSEIQLFYYLLPIISVIFLKRWSNRLIRPLLFSLISWISLPDLGGIPSEVWILNLRGSLVFPGWILVGYS